MNSITQAPTLAQGSPARSARSAWLTRFQHPLVLGLLAVLMFAMTIPMTRLATVQEGHAQLPPAFIATARSVLAALVSALYLWHTRAAWPARAQWPCLVAVVAGGVLAFPLGMGWAVSQLPAWQVAMGTAILPLFTAALASVWMGQRPPARFWWAGLAGAALVAWFGWQQSAQAAASAVGLAPGLAGEGAGRAHPVGWAWGSLLVGLLGAAMAYVGGARAARHMPAAQVMSWAQLLALPLTAPLTLWAVHQALGGQVSTQALQQACAQVGAPAWWALLYVGVVSSWLGFLAWYAALARDALRVSQCQLLQPLVAVVLAHALLGEAVSAWALPVGLCVALCMWFGQRSLRR